MRGARGEKAKKAARRAHVPSVPSLPAAALTSSRDSMTPANCMPGSPGNVCNRGGGVARAEAARGGVRRRRGLKPSALARR